MISHQGPFREPWEVQKQRYRPSRPSFRASGDYYAMEKARKQKKFDDWVASVGAERWVREGDRTEVSCG